MPWYSVLVRYDDPIKDSLLLDAVQPLFDRLQACGEAYFRPHWRRGPHIRLNFRTTDELFSQVVLPTTREALGTFLAEHPSTTRLDPAVVLPMHRRLAELENDTAPLEPWLPNNSIHATAYQERSGALGSRELARILTAFDVATTPLVFSMLDHVRRGGQRLRLAFDLMIATAHGLSGMSPAGFVSFRSHSEAFITNESQSGSDRSSAGRRAGWERHYDRHSASLTTRLSHILATLDGAGKAVPFVRAWVDALEPYGVHAHALATAEQPLIDAAGEDPYGTLVPARSPFHRTLGADEAIALLRSPAFTRYRLMLNLTYLHMTRLGISPEERFLLCHLAAAAAEDVFGSSSQELAHDLVRRAAG
ncbi:thiopeptide maturation pyridine synthase [Streptomyces sp. NPDC001568]|uniref:thiopeptide maturation pyridine synthase n=1 Tax=Streptomyces sp. NPDC001568 TaxID=3364588 RepID=UPI00369F8544